MQALLPTWIDTHCHLDAAEFAPDLDAVRQRARTAGVGQVVIPGVAVANFEAVRQLAHTGDDAYALGIHPLYVPSAAEADLAALATALKKHRGDPRLVAVGEIGLDLFVPALKESPLREKQEFFYREQLRLAREHGLPVILHVRRSADRLLKHLRELAPAGGWQGIAHAFNGSAQQAQAFVHLGLKLGFGGTLTFEASKQIRQLAIDLPLSALVLETDAPDIPPHWLYRRAEARAAGQAQGRNEPGELPRIAAVLAGLRGISLEALAEATSANARAALPGLTQGQSGCLITTG
jgi:TatD DNase family protein